VEKGEQAEHLYTPGVVPPDPRTANTNACVGPGCQALVWSFISFWSRCFISLDPCSILLVLGPQLQGLSWPHECPWNDALEWKASSSKKKRLKSINALGFYYQPFGKEKPEGKKYVQGDGSFTSPSLLLV
jgi:hypothetical protein